MYQLQICGPKGRRTLRWDPHKLRERDPITLAKFAEAERLLKEALTQNRAVLDGNPPHPRIAVFGRWVEN
jgi:hypothetical protein